MAQMNCSCGFKEQMITEMQSLWKQCPGKETEWINLLFPATERSTCESLCCLLTYLFYYGYCKECTLSLSEEARSVLAPLMGKQEPSIS